MKIYLVKGCYYYVNNSYVEATNGLDCEVFCSKYNAGVLYTMRKEELLILPIIKYDKNKYLIDR